MAWLTVQPTPTRQISTRQLAARSVDQVRAHLQTARIRQDSASPVMLHSARPAVPDPVTVPPPTRRQPGRLAADVHRTIGDPPVVQALED